MNIVTESPSTKKYRVKERNDMRDKFRDAYWKRIGEVQMDVLPLLKPIGLDELKPTLALDTEG